MAGTDNLPDLPLTELMNLAADGDRNAAEIFLGRFLSELFFVLNRQQTFEMSDQPEYPGELVSILGVKDGDRVVVPAFTQADLIEDWCGSKLENRSLSGQRLLSIVPDDWWICLNPGSGLEKEFSPWEITQLKGGSQNFAAIIEELYADEGPTQLNVEPIAAGEFSGLISALQEAVLGIPEVLSLYALKEGDKESGNTTILVGALLKKNTDESRQNLIQDNLKSVANLAQIGAEPTRFLIADNFDQSPQLSVFKLMAPFFERPDTATKGALSGLKKFLKI
jgi:hypothetical protein